MMDIFILNEFAHLVIAFSVKGLGGGIFGGFSVLGFGVWGLGFGFGILGFGFWVLVQISGPRMNKILISNEFASLRTAFGI